MANVEEKYFLYKNAKRAFDLLRASKQTLQDQRAQAIAGLAVIDTQIADAREQVRVARVNLEAEITLGEQT